MTPTQKRSLKKAKRAASAVPYMTMADKQRKIHAALLYLKASLRPEVK